MEGLIPTHAGKTTCSNDCTSPAQAHPHSRGENPRPAQHSTASAGSSPLTRGKRVTGCNKPVTRGLIPTHAGKTSGRPSWLGPFGAHPHSRGENYSTCPFRRAVPGSSPLTRGKRSGSGLRGVSVVAHPHSRGENAPATTRIARPGGSSPLTRGKRRPVASRAQQLGLIPTHAGKTRRRRRARRGRRAHPHSRGENTEADEDSRALWGSSPLTRGKHFLTCAFIAQIGQILESLELCASSESYSLMDAYATDAPQDQVRSTGLAPRRSRDAS